MSSKKKPAAAKPQVAEPEIQKPEAPVEQAAESVQETAEPNANSEPEIIPENIPSAEATEEEVVDGLPEINAALRPMKPADGTEGSCELYKSDKHGHVLVPASEVPGMLEHGFVLVDDA